MTFIQQERGPYAGELLLPGGKVEFAESLEQAAAREALEESGCQAEGLRLTGLYEIHSVSGSYHWVTAVFVAQSECRVPEGFAGHHVREVFQARPSQVRPHPTVMRMLVDAGVADYPMDEIEAALAVDEITMTCHLSLAPVS